MSEIIDSYELDLNENIKLAASRLSTPIEGKQDWK